MFIDVLIIGGSFAGLSAAMPLVRGRRKVLLLDTKMPRNRFASASHGVFCLDGKAPADIQAEALSQLRQYPTFEFKEDEAIAIEKIVTDFVISTRAGSRYIAKKVILAFGIQDQLPDIPGVETFWGKNVIHCPYCHGYELSGGPLGVLATHELSSHQAAMIPDWGPTTLFIQGKHYPKGEQAATLKRRGVTLEHTPVVQVVGSKDRMSSVLLEDGRSIELQGLYVAPTITIQSPLVDALGLVLQQNAMGAFIEVDEFKESSVKGVFVAGDLSNPLQNGTFAIASGTLAGIAAHRALMFNC
ncbi:NAD(P)/FAD-dependent oxidoreductase [Aliidiomarina maris]|uniref:Thioredoxin reductase n=2 Tax=Aliidiomarina maris TaxID=531312 RepID=A0A327X3E6_9GAMM|nr:NAD(P)/FAD-dependent oxidoreductase [Aliidiomarina maris]RAK01385.1 thioredoxin reductase [Aliidiomarina maris]RUO28234.1 thioredoxin reductase [Aliidiomarina maris]